MPHKAKEKSESDSSFLEAKSNITKKRAEEVNPMSHQEDVQEKLDISEREQTAVDNLFEMFRDAVDLNQEVKEMQEKAHRVYQVGVLDQEVPEVKGVSQEINTNFGKALIKNVQARLTDRNPRPIAKKRNPDDALFAELVDSTMQWVLDVNDWREARDNAVVDCTNKGNSFVKVMWDQSMGENGNISVEHIDPFRVFPASHAPTVDKQDRIFIIHSEPASQVIDKFKRLNNALDTESGKRKQALSNIEEKVIASAGRPPVNDRNIEKVVNLMMPGGVMQQDVQLKDMLNAEGSAGVSPDQNYEDNVNYVEAYIRYPDGHPLSDQYKKGRLVYFTSEGLLGDFAWQKDRWPLAKFELEPEGEYFWNEPISLPIASLQKSINALSTLIMKAATVHAFPPFLTTPNSGVKRDEFQNVGPANRVLRVSPEAMQAGTGWMNPPPFPEAAFQLREKLIQEMEQILGVHDVTQGRTPGSIQSGSALARLKESDQTAIRLQSRGFNKGLKKVGKLIVENIKSHFNEERFIHVGDDERGNFIQLNTRADVEKAKQFLRDKSNINDQRAKEIIRKARQRQSDRSKNRQVAKEGILMDPQIASVDLRIGGGDDSRLSKIARAEDAMRLTEMGAMDIRGLLEALDWENKERIIDKLDREKKLAQQVDGLQERVENLKSTINEITNTLSGQEQQKVLSALNSVKAKQQG